MSQEKDSPPGEITIQEMSDLHLEIFSQDEYESEGWRYPPISSQADFVVLAGDITDAKTVNRLEDWAWDSDKPEFIYVPGNHEFYQGDIDITEASLRARFRTPRKNVRYLNNDVYIPWKQPPTRERKLCFVGTTLWSYIPPGTETDFRGMNDSRVVEGMTAQKWNDLHTKAVVFLNWALEKYSQEFDVVVITHHGPSFKSMHPKWTGDVFNKFYYTELSDLILKYKPKVWFHGHTHDSHGYYIGDTRVICNPSGYGHNPEYKNKQFDPRLLVKV